jgi:hypothetical protein
MSVEFTAASRDEIYDTTTNMGLGPAITVALRAKVDVTQTDGISRAITITDSGSFRTCISLYEVGGNWARQFRVNDGAQKNSSGLFGSGGLTCSTTSFDSVVVTLFGDTTFSIYANGTIYDDAATIPASVDFTGVTDFNDITIGGRAGANQDWDGFLADVAVWNAALSDDEALSYTNGLSPLAIRPQSLHVHHEGLTGTVNEKMQNISLTYSTEPSLSNSDNPQIIFPE